MKTFNQLDSLKHTKSIFPDLGIIEYFNIVNLLNLSGGQYFICAILLLLHQLCILHLSQKNNPHRFSKSKNFYPVAKLKL